MRHIVGGRYPLHESLGSGGTRTVYRATDRLTGNLVALKRVTYAPDGESSVSPTGRYHTDAPRLALASQFQLLASLRHPHIISVLDYGFEVDFGLDEEAPQRHQPYFTMIREGFLQAARFVGREAELSRLVDALHSAMAGHGSMWLTGGEGGIGKSRLLSELGTRALLAGVLVLSGRLVARGGLVYQYWREPLRRLVLTTELSDLEAAILRPIVPDVDVLLGRDIPDVPLLEGQAGRQCLLDTICRLLQECAALIPDLALRWSFLENVPYHREIIQASSER